MQSIDVFSAKVKGKKDLYCLLQVNRKYYHSNTNPYDSNRQCLASKVQALQDDFSAANFARWEESVKKRLSRGTLIPYGYLRVRDTKRVGPGQEPQEVRWVHAGWRNCSGAVSR